MMSSWSVTFCAEKRSAGKDTLTALSAPFLFGLTEATSNLSVASDTTSRTCADAVKPTESTTASTINATTFSMAIRRRTVGDSREPIYGRCVGGTQSADRLDGAP